MKKLFVMFMLSLLLALSFAFAASADEIQEDPEEVVVEVIEEVEESRLAPPAPASGIGTSIAVVKPEEEVIEAPETPLSAGYSSRPMPSPLSLVLILGGTITLVVLGMIEVTKKIQKKAEGKK